MGECVVIESIAKIVGIVNVAYIGVIMGGNGILIIDALLSSLLKKLRNKEDYKFKQNNNTNNKINNLNKYKVTSKNKNTITNKKTKSLSVLYIKIRNFLLVEKFFNLLKEHRIKKLKAYSIIKKLNVCEDTIAYTRAYYVKKYSMVVWIVLIMNIASLVIIDNIVDSKINKSSPNKYINDIKKPNYGEKSKKAKYNLEIIDQMGIVKKAILDIDIEPNRLNVFDEAKLIQEAKDEIYKKVLGKNKSYKKVYYDLDLVSKVDVDSNISVTWKTGESSAIDYKGAINYDYIEEYLNKKQHAKQKEQKKYEKQEEYTKKKNQLNQGIDVTIIAIIKYFDREYEYPIELKVYKKREDEETKVLNAIKEEVNVLNKQYDRQGVVKLPKKVAGYHIKYYEVNEDNYTSIWCMCMLIGIVCIYIVIKYKELDFKKDIKNKEEQLIMSYAEIVTKIKMLVIAGLTIEGALKKICEDYESQRIEGSINYAYEEMLYTYKDIEVGTSTIQAFELMGKRIGIGPYIRLSSIIIQNIKNGTEGFINSLESEVRTLERKREETYIKKGGELGAKLLLPMMLLMGITLLIVMLPALLTI